MKTPVLVLAVDVAVVAVVDVAVVDVVVSFPVFLLGILLWSWFRMFIANGARPKRFPTERPTGIGIITLERIFVKTCVFDHVSLEAPQPSSSLHAPRNPGFV